MTNLKDATIRILLPNDVVELVTSTQYENRAEELELVEMAYEEKELVIRIGIKNEDTLA